MSLLLVIMVASCTWVLIDGCVIPVPWTPVPMRPAIDWTSTSPWFESAYPLFHSRLATSLSFIPEGTVAVLSDSLIVIVPFTWSVRMMIPVLFWMRRECECDEPMVVIGALLLLAIDTAFCAS